MPKKLSKTRAKIVLGFGIFLVLGGVFGVYMQASGQDSNASVNGFIMLFIGILAIIYGSSNLK